MRREKRSAQIRANIPPSMREQLELFRAEESMGQVLSLSDYLFGVIEQHIAIKNATRKPAIRAHQEILSRRMAEQA